MKFWKRKNVIVTGGSGFLGQVIVEMLQKKNLVLKLKLPSSLVCVK